MTRLVPLPNIATLSASFQKDAALLTAVRGRWCETSCHWSQTPFLHIGFDEDKAHLTKIHMDCARSVGAHGGEKILRLQAVRHVFELLSIAGEENSSSSWSIADSNNVALDILWPVTCWYEWLVVSTMPRRQIGHRGFVEACVLSVTWQRPVSFMTYRANGKAGTAWWSCRC